MLHTTSEHVFYFYFLTTFLTLVKGKKPHVPTAYWVVGKNGLSSQEIQPQKIQLIKKSSENSKWQLMIKGILKSSLQHCSKMI